MSRLHLFEFEDLPWFPSLLRRYMQDFLELMGRLGSTAYRPVSAPLLAAMTGLRTSHLVDLCSGAGGPLRGLLEQLERRGLRATATLTDLYPNRRAFRRLEQASGGRIGHCAEPVDARAVPETLSGFRLLCNGLHHLRPEDAGRVLSDAVARGQGIAVVEVVSRSVWSIATLPLVLLILLLVTPILRPFRLSRLVFTYLVPVVPLCLLWDGFVSCLRVYSPRELRRLVAGMDSYHWQIDRQRMLTYLVGAPRAQWWWPPAVGAAATRR